MQPLHDKTSMKSLPGLILLSVVILLVSSCNDNGKIDVLSGITPGRMPTMKTVGVNTIISDSGITKYRIKSPVWYVYDEIDTPKWKFPKGLYLEQFDAKMKVIGSVACDSAVYFKMQGIWRLDGHVEMHNNQKDLFMTQQLYWDQQQHKIYSDSFIHIERSDRVLEGHCFESNENLTTYRILKPTGIFPADLSRPEGINQAPPPGFTKPEMITKTASH